MSRNLFLFGAGASFGSDSTGTPPLGESLFDALQRYNPDGWGALSSDLGRMFKDDFELGMQNLSESHSSWMPPLQRAMAAYFFNFAPSPNNLYIRLASLISSAGWQGAIATLNYERLLEVSLIHEGVLPVVGSETTAANQIELCLPHGCCHIFCDSVQGSARGIVFSGTAVSTSGKVRPIAEPSEFMKRIQSDAFPPVMSYFEPRKLTSSGANFIESQRNRWGELVYSANTIAVVGIAVRPHDDHIWGPLSQSEARIVYCSGKSAGDDYRIWQETVRPNSSDLVIDEYFDQAFPVLCDEIGLN